MFDRFLVAFQHRILSALISLPFFFVILPFVLDKDVKFDQKRQFFLRKRV